MLSFFSESPARFFVRLIFRSFVTDRSCNPRDTALPTNAVQDRIDHEGEQLSVGHVALIEREGSVSHVLGHRAQNIQVEQLDRNRPTTLGKPSVHEVSSHSSSRANERKEDGNGELKPTGE